MDITGSMDQLSSLYIKWNMSMILSVTFAGYYTLGETIGGLKTREEDMQTWKAQRKVWSCVNVIQDVSC